MSGVAVALQGGLSLLLVAALAWYFLYPGGSSTAPATGAPPTTGQYGPAAPTVAMRMTHDGGDHGEEG